MNQEDPALPAVKAEQSKSAKISTTDSVVALLMAHFNEALR
jgi:hypothetical protein